MPPLLLLAILNVQISFLVCYIYTFDYFPLEIRGNAMKWCNMTARACTILSPLVAELDDPIPIAVVMAEIGIALLCSFMLEDEERR